MSLIPLLEPIRPEIERVERLLHETLASVEEPLGPTLDRLLDGGKRLRSALVVLTGQVFGASGAPFHSLAAALDMLHAATLIHDDVMDVSPLRRGCETLHTVWPARAAVLAGDYLLGQATALIADLEHPRICKAFATVLRTMCAGEIRQMLVIRGRHRCREEYYRSSEAKTASLFAATTEMAGVLARAGGPEIAALHRFGREFGLAFQIVDDVLDLTGDEAQLGKPAGSDLRQGLLTLPILCYLERAEGDNPVNAVLSGQRDEEHVRAAIEVVRSSGAIEVALEEARGHVRQSQGALATLPDNAARHTLCALAGYVVERRQ
jgi:geranylgeranyl pyrophosphate synthase